MTPAKLRAATVLPVRQAHCPVVVRQETAAGVVEVPLTAARYEPVTERRLVDGKEVQVLVSERLVLLARAGEIPGGGS